MSDVRECIVEMGYYPDRFVDAGLPPDVFFMHVYADDVADIERELLGAMEMLVWAACDKYHLLNPERGFDIGFYPFDWQDTFWSATPPPGELEP